MLKKCFKSLNVLDVIVIIVGIALAFGIIVDKAGADTVIVQPAVTSSVPTVTVPNVSSPALTGKVQIAWLSTKSHKVHGCKKVKSFAKSGHATCIILPVGKKYTSSGSDRFGAFRTVAATTTKSDRTFYKGSDHNWWTVLGQNLVSMRAPELQANQVVIVKSFKDVPYDVDVSLSVTNAVSVPPSCQAIGSPSGTASAVTTVHVVAKYVPDAKTLAVQQLAQSFRDQVYGNATSAAVNNLKCSSTPTTPPDQDDCPDCGLPLAPMLSMEMNSQSAVFDPGSQNYIYIKVQAVPGQQVSLDLGPSDGQFVSQVDSDTYYDNQPCPSGYVCFRALYQAPAYEVSPVYLSGFAATQDGSQYGYGEITISIVEGGFGNSLLNSTNYFL